MAKAKNPKHDLSSDVDPNSRTTVSGPAKPDASEDPGLIVGAEGDARSAVDKFVKALGRHRHFERDTDPPRV